MGTGRLAIVYCVHHKPWLMMATLITTLMQDRPDADLYFAYNVGDGSSNRGSYQEYSRIAAAMGANRQLSPFDDRVRDVCRLRRDRIVELEYENDHALDSGVWYKFIREGRWRDYDRVLFLGEGAILAHPRLLDALVDFSVRRDVHFIASGHEKRRVPRDVSLRIARRGGEASALDRYHERMLLETFAVFCRDPEFRAVYDRWGSDFAVETENHVPAAPEAAWLRRARAWSLRRWGSPYDGGDVPVPARGLRALPFVLDEWGSRASVRFARGADVPEADTAYYNGTPRPATYPDAVDGQYGVRFHREPGPEWFGCTVLHLLSHDLLARFAERLERFGLYDALDLPFAGSALEVIWGFLPAWLGFEKWFTNGFHRVRKHFTTYRREDYPPEMASYINRYHRGRLAVGWHGDYLKLRSWRSDLGDVRRVLPPVYFQGPREEEP